MHLIDPVIQLFFIVPLTGKSSSDIYNAPTFLSQFVCLK